MTFGGKLQKLRKSRGWTQEELAGRVGVSRQALSKWESGAVQPDTEHVVKLSDLFGVTTDYLLKAEQPETPLSAPAVAAQKHGISAQMLAGGILGGLSVLGLLVMGIFASLGDWEILYPVEASDGAEVACQVGKRGLMAFLEIKHLEWLFFLLLFLTVAGAILLYEGYRQEKRETQAK